MANNAQNILVAGDAVLNIALGHVERSKWAKTVDEVLDPAFSGEVGLIDEDGETFAREVSTKAKNAHQQSSVRTIIESGEATFKFAALEANKLVIDLWNGTVLSSGQTYREVDASNALNITFTYTAIDTSAGFEKATRIVGYGLITPNGELKFKNNDTTVYPFTISINGAYRFIQEDVSA